MNPGDPWLHVRGASQYVDDLPEPAGLLHAAVAVSPHARARLRRVDPAAAAGLPGVHAVFTAADIPGRNQIGTIVPDEPLLAHDALEYLGQPVALVIADTAARARAAARAVRFEADPEPPVFDPREAFARGELLVPSRVFRLGDVDAAWPRCAAIVEGRAESGGQEHLYLETQAAWAQPLEHGGVRIHSATQGPTAVQRAAAQVLGLGMHQVEVDVPRLGGGFGGKEDQATAWAVLAALAAARLRRPVKLVLRRQEDLRWTGKRHPYSSDFRLGLDADGRMLAYEVVFYQDGGAATDLSPAILERTLFHATASYHVPHVRATGHSCRTNRAPNTAFRGFGGPQAMFVMECAIWRAAERLGVDPAAIQERNLLREGDEFPYGQRAERARARACWDEAARAYDIPAREREVRVFNAAHRLRKKGLARMPVCFGISFTNTMMNQARALVHVYTDGSVGVSTAAVEMGQGVNTKLRRIAARAFGIDPARVRLETTNTTRVANTSPTAASVGSDINGHAVLLACEEILGRLRRVAAETVGAPGDAETVEIRDGQAACRGRPLGLTWEQLVQKAYQARVSLSAHAHYATPGLEFDKGREKGRPFAYHAYGTAILEVTLDVLRGTYTVDAVRIVHDVGQSLDLLVDRGQVEGGLAQGLGWMTTEELRYAPDGRLLTDTLTTYKVPDLYAAPAEIDVRFLDGADNPPGPFHSKAIGEPPFMFGIGVYFALAAAAKAARPAAAVPLDAPFTPEKMLMLLHGAPAEPAAP